MLSKSLLSFGIIASCYVSAAPTLVARSPGSNWTVAEFTRTCNDTSDTCLYTYLITENDPSIPPTPCNYTILGSPTLSARTTDYTALAGCSSPAYSLNQGWNDPGQFATLVVTNLTSQFRAFYGFGIAQLGDGVVQANQTAVSMTSGVPPPAVVVGGMEKRLNGWVVEGFVWEADAPLSSTYHFTVNQGYDSFTCTVVNAPADPKTDWSNEACLESEVHVISWGYSTEGFAVMTVRDNTVFPGSYALFGYAGVNTWKGSVNAANVGPQPVQEA